MENNTEYYVKNLSYSQLRTFTTNPGEWQNNRVMWIYDNTTWVSAATWIMLHKFVELYLKEGDIDNAIKTAYSCLYDGDDLKTYLIDPSDSELYENDKISFEKVKQHWKTRVVDFKKTWSNEKILKGVEAWINAFLSEQIDYGELLGCEKSMEHIATDILWWDMKVESPIPFTAISDEVCRTTNERYIMVDGELQAISPGALFVEDTKFKSKHTEMNIEDPTYIFQAFFNYYCLKAEYWESPKFMIFREIKTSKNKDGSSQHQTITIPFFGETFEEYKVYFWRYILETFERIKIIQERDFIFNIFDMYNWENEWNKQKAFYLGVPVGQLKSKIAMTQKNKIGSKVQIMGDRDPMKNLKRIDGKNVLSEDLNTIENKIKIAFQNFGVLATFEKKNEWYSFDQYLFKTARGVTMSKVKSHLPEIIQALELEGIRIEAPVLWTKFIGVEIPRWERKFAKLEKIKKSNQPLVPIGIDINGKEEFVDLSDSWSPHMIVAWKTWSWKSEFLKTAVYSLKDKWDIILFDPKRIWLTKVKKYAWKDNYFTDLEVIDFKLKMYLQEMNNIYTKLEEMEYESIYEANDNIKGRWKRKFKETFIFIDEFASLAYAKIDREIIDKNGNPKVVSENIGESIIWTVRQLTNLWRAAWIHLVIATQRPDIQVIPGNIKANVSTRVCFALASEIDSKVVLDEIGAEKLLSKWDMLFKNEGKMRRLQGFYI